MYDFVQFCGGYYPRNSPVSTWRTRYPPKEKAQLVRLGLMATVRGAWLGQPSFSVGVRELPSTW